MDFSNILWDLDGGGIDDATKEAFLGNAPVISGCGGLDDPQYQEIRRRSG